jgi:hypothetical protein
VVGGVAAVAVLAALIATAGAANATQTVKPADTTPPSATTFSSTDYPVNGPTTVTFGQSGTITLAATDPGPHASGVAGFAYQIDGPGLAVDSSLNIRAKGGKATLTIPLSWLSAGTNTVQAQTVDNAGLRSPIATYDFFIAGTAFPPPVAGDADGDGVPDLVTVDAVGGVRLFSNPGMTTVDPTGDTVSDPQQFGGVVAFPAPGNMRWPMPDSASAAGALVTHSGSITGGRTDDILVVQHGFLGVAHHVGPPTQFTFATTNVSKPGCGICANYNGQDWSSVTQLVAVASTPTGPPNLLTVEVVNDTATLWWYPAGTGLFFQSPVAVSTNTAGWNWNDLQIIGAGPLPGSTGVSVWVRNPDTGTLYVLHDVAAGIPDPASAAVVIGTGFTASVYPLLTTDGRPDASGDVPLWGATANGQLAIIPTTTTNAGVTRVGSAQAVSGKSWASHEIALGASYPLYNNSGVAATGSPNQAFDTATTNSFTYNADALGNAIVDPNDIVNDGSGGCPTGWTACVPGLGSSTSIAIPNDQGTFDTFTMPAPWAHDRDNYVAAGQLLPVPVPGTSGPAHVIRFLGAAATTDTVNGASVPATVTYTDGHTQAITITFANWTQNVSAAPVAGNTIVATMDHRTVAATGADDPTTTYLFATPQIALLDNGALLGPQVQIASVRLGTNSAVHVFAIALS